MQRQPQDEQNDCDRDDAVANGVFLDCGELFVGHCDGPGQPRARLILRKHFCSGRTNGRARSVAGLDRTIIEYRMDFDEAAQLARQGRTILGSDSPGKACGTAGQHVLQRIGRHIKDPREIVELEIARLNAEEAVFETADKAAQARIGGEVVDEGLTAIELGDGLRELVSRLEEQSVTDEEVTAARLGYLPHLVFLGGKRLGERRSCLARQFGGRGLDDDENQLVALKRPLELELAFAPVEVGGEEGRDVRVDGEMAGGIDA